MIRRGLGADVTFSLVGWGQDPNKRSKRGSVRRTVIADVTLL